MRRKRGDNEKEGVRIRETGEARVSGASVQQ